MNRFIEVTDSDIENLVKIKHSENTQKVVDGAVILFNEYCATNK